MSDFDKSRLSNEMQKDVLDYMQTGEDALYWLGNNKDVTVDEIITRIQSSNIETISRSGLRTVDEWATSNAPLKTVRKSLAPVSNTDKYSSFALIEKPANYGTLRYPLNNSYISKNILFANKTFPKYKELINKVQDAYKIKIIEKNDRDALFSYKRSGKVVAKLKNVGLGVVNLCRRVFKKTKFTAKPNYKGKIKINNSIVYNSKNVYKISEQEKFTKILDSILAVTVNSTAKKLNSKLGSNVLFFSRLYADILLSRAINYGDVETNRNIESSLTLQMSNVLAGLDLTPEQIKEASSIGLISAENAIKKLGLSLSDVKQSVQAAGYNYDEEPETMQDALLPKNALIKEGDEEALNKSEEILGLPFYRALPNLLHPPVSEFSKLKDKESKIAEANDKKISDKKDLDGVKDSTVYLTKSSAKKYIDKVVLNCLKKQIDKSISGINDENATEKKLNKFKRQYNFVEHMYTFYDKNKENESDELDKLIERELVNGGDNNFAHSFGKSFLDFRQNILDKLFADKDVIEKKQGKAIATVINDFVEEHYNKKLSTYLLDTLKKSLTSIFNEIDENKFEPKNLVGEEKQ